MLLRVFWSCCGKIETGQTLCQQLPTFLLFRDRRSVANNVGSVCIAPLSLLGPGTRVKHGLRRDRKSYRLYPSHNALQVPTLLWVVASVCTPLPTRAQQLPTLLSQHCFEFLPPFGHHCRQERNNFQRCFELLHPFAHHCQHGRNNFQHCCRNNGLRNTNRLSLLFLGESKRRWTNAVAWNFSCGTFILGSQDRWLQHRITNFLTSKTNVWCTWYELAS